MKNDLEKETIDVPIIPQPQPLHRGKVMTEAEYNVKYLKAGFIWALKRLSLVLSAIAGIVFAGWLLLACFPAFIVLVIIIILVTMTIFKAREDYWQDNKEYPTANRLIRRATNTGPK